jgi:hypothetical protein
MAMAAMSLIMDAWPIIPGLRGPEVSRASVSGNSSSFVSLILLWFLVSSPPVLGLLASLYRPPLVLCGRIHHAILLSLGVL